MKTITLVNSTQRATVDDADFDRINKYEWHAIKVAGKTHAARLCFGDWYLMEHEVLFGSPEDADAQSHSEEKIPHVIYLPLTQGKWAMVDSDVPEEIWGHKWNGCGKYAKRKVGPAGKQKSILLHRVILALPAGTEGDHIDGDGRNNLRSNLRPATAQQNSQGYRSKRKGASSQYRGVTWHRGKWQAAICKTYIGRFESEIAAAKAYDAAAKKRFGEFASPNFL